MEHSVYVRVYKRIQCKHYRTDSIMYLSHNFNINVITETLLTILPSYFWQTVASFYRHQSSSAAICQAINRR